MNMYWFGVYISVVVSMIEGIVESDDCFALLNKCQARYNCFSALINVKFECHDLLFGEGWKGCTESCKEALNLFNRDKLGKRFMNCACERDSECLTYQARAGKCIYNRMNETTVGCAKFSRRCTNDTGCSDIMEKFFVKCNHLISGTECTPTCEYVQELLYSHNITKGLLDCECSGTVREENFCRGVRAHTFYLCKNSPLVRKAEVKNKSTVKDESENGRGNGKITVKSVEASASNSLNSYREIFLRVVLGLSMLCIRYTL